VRQPVERVTLTFQRDDLTGDIEVMVEHHVWKGLRWRGAEGPKWYAVAEDVVMVVRAFVSTWRAK